MQAQLHSELDQLIFAFVPKVPVVLVASSTKAKKRRKGAPNNNNSKHFNDVVDNGIIVDDIIVDTTGDNPAGFDGNGNVDEGLEVSKTIHLHRQYLQVPMI